MAMKGTKTKGFFMVKLMVISWLVTMKISCYAMKYPLIQHEFPLKITLKCHGKLMAFSQHLISYCNQ